ncbi:MAG TPA: collagen-like protein [Thermoleophilaceae bacterium]|jgi:hypothetical protein
MKRHISYANVVATLALFLALGGGAFAATKITGKQIKNGSLTGSDLKKHSISLNRLKGKLPAGKTGAPGTPGTPGAPGAPGTALAYAHVNADGTLDAANSKNVDRTSGIATAGYYCIQTSVPVHNVVVTPDSPTVARTATAGKSDPFTSCGAFDPTKPRGDVVVTTFSGTTATNTAFWIAIN